ncbi:pyruvate phosphate dikinase [Vibrio phage vB_VcaS_HC]|nr:pyruvate phosphate dikinase [Vibrio phage vB_VcaS_HC]
MSNYVYKFDPETTTDGCGDMVNLLGGKGANLAEMANLGLPVPPGLTVSSGVFEQWRAFKDIEQRFEFVKNITKNEVMPVLEEIARDQNRPCLWSVRSGAAVSMPGMMDTILNVGINPENLKDYCEHLGERTATDCRRRFLQMYASTVYGHETIDAKVNELLADLRKQAGVATDAELSAVDIGRVCVMIANELEEHVVPYELDLQLAYCINAVFESWDNDRAKYYRKMNGIGDAIGTAVTVQLMVFGNASDKSGSGVMFSSDPNTGDALTVGEYLCNAQGEDVVAGVRTPVSLWEAVEAKQISQGMYKQLMKVAKQLETHYKNMQDIEFTIEDKRLYLLQTRNAKRTGIAAVNYAIDSLKSGLWQRGDLRKLTPREVLESLQPKLEGDVPPPYVTGIAASVGIISGVPCFSIEEIEIAKEDGKRAIFVAEDTSAEDIELFNEADAVLTMIGGFTSHAAVVARGMNKPCVVGCTGENYAEAEVILADLSQTPEITLDGATGIIYEGALEISEPSEDDLNELLELAGFEEENDDRRYIDITNLDAEEVGALVSLHTKHSDQELVLHYAARRPGALLKVFGYGMIPENLNQALPKLAALYDPEAHRFELSTPYNLDYLRGREYDFIVRHPEKPSDYLKSGSVRSSDQALTTVFGTLSAAKLFLGAIEKQGVKVAQHYRAPKQPLKQFIKYLHEGA